MVSSILNIFSIEDNRAMNKDAIQRHLPVRPAAFAVLAILANGPHAGFEIMEAAHRLPGRPLFGPGTLYRLLRELRQQELIEPTPAPKGVARDERRQYHSLTALGRAVLTAEGTRVRATLEACALLRAHG